MAFALPSGLTFCAVIGVQVASGIPSLACDIKWYSVEKGVELTQTNTEPPVPRTANGYVFRAELAASGPNLILGATVAAPNGTTKTLAMASDNQEFSYDKKEDTSTILESTFPNGNYVLTVNTANDGVQRLMLPLQGDTYPATAHLLAFDLVQTIDAGVFNEFRWQYLNDGAFPDYVQFRVEDSQGDKVFETADDGPAALDGGVNVVLLPPGTLAANQVYKGTLETRRTVFTDTTSCVPAIGLARYYRRVTFAILTRPTATSSDIISFSVLKTELWDQSGANPPTPASKNGYVFEAKLDTTSPGRVVWANLSTPLGTSNLDPNSDASSFGLKDRKDTKNGLDTAFPSGAYVFNIAGVSNGSMNAGLQLGADAYPDPPRFLDPDQAQAIDPGNDFTLKWNPFASGTASDFIQLQVDDENGDKVFETPDFEKAKAFTGLRTSATLPAGTLAAGKTYTAKLLFLRVVQKTTAGYPGALGIAGFGRETRLQIRTAGGVVTPPRITGYQFIVGGGFALRVSGSPGASYRLEASSDLRNWSTLADISLTGSETEYVVPTDTSSMWRFYRLVQQ
jgi:hypothetical protein